VSQLRPGRGEPGLHRTPLGKDTDGGDQKDQEETGAGARSLPARLASTATGL